METKISCSAANAIITACEKIAHSFLENVLELSLIRPDWNVEYARDLISKINYVKVHYLSNVSRNMLPNKKACAHEVLISSLKDISLLYGLIEVDFKDDITFQNLIFETLGYTEYYRDAKNGDLCSLYLLVDMMYKNLTRELVDVITSRTIDSKLLEKICGYREEINKFSFCSNFTDQSRLISREGQTEVNKVYSEIKDICRVTTAHYLFDPIRRDQFSFYLQMQNQQEPFVGMN